MRYSHVLWDFNGTVLDDVDAGIKSVNTLLKRRGLPTVDSVEFYRGVFGFPVTDYYKKLGFDLDGEDFAKVAVEWVEQYNTNSEDSPLCPYVREALETLKDAGLEQIILTASELGMVSAQLEKLGLTEFFTQIIGLDNIHAESKEHIARRWFENVKPSRAVMIGDTLHDAQVAHAVGADCLLVCRGHQSRETLLSSGYPVLDDVLKAAEYILIEDNG